MMEQHFQFAGKSHFNLLNIKCYLMSHKFDIKILKCAAGNNSSRIPQKKVNKHILHNKIADNQPHKFVAKFN